MRSKLYCLLMAVLVVFCLGTPAQASEYTGSIQIHMGMEEGEVALYYIGSMTEDGYLLEEAYGGGFLKEEDVYSPALAQWLAESITGEGRYRLISPGEPVEYTQVRQGLYLLIQTKTQKGYSPIEPFLAPLPYEGEWHIQVNPKSQEIPHTGQDPAPFAGLLGMVLSGTALVICYRKRKCF